jgi:hypothetical protein
MPGGHNAAGSEEQGRPPPIRSTEIKRQLCVLIAVSVRLYKTGSPSSKRTSTFVLKHGWNAAMLWRLRIACSLTSSS